jgi:hypothetical protein
LPDEQLAVRLTDPPLLGSVDGFALSVHPEGTPGAGGVVVPQVIVHDPLEPVNCGLSQFAMLRLTWATPTAGANAKVASAAAMLAGSDAFMNIGNLRLSGTRKNTLSYESYLHRAWRSTQINQWAPFT